MAKKKKDNNFHKQEQGLAEAKESVMELHGVIDEAMPGTLFNVVCESGHRVIATLSGKLRINHIRLLPGDSVAVEVSPYDLSRGRITWRK